ncbi:SusD family protein [compost metagenome]
MKKINPIIVLILLSGILLSSCEKYLDVIPKGKKIPQNIADFEAFIQNPDMHFNDMTTPVQLTNEFYTNSAAINAVNLTSINFNWIEDKSRVDFLESDEAYNNAYKGIYYSNLIIDGVPDAIDGTPEQKDALIAQAKTLRAMSYFFLVNRYAKHYNAASASTDLAVPLNLKPDFEQVPPQVTVKEIYDLILSDLNSSVAALPAKSKNSYCPNKATGYGMLARTYLFMKDFDKALTNANLALGQSDVLFDMVKYYQDNKKTIDATANPTLPKIDFLNPENYLFRFGSTSNKIQGLFVTGSIPAKDSVRFEPGDTRYRINFKPRKVGADTICNFFRADDFNGGGMRSPEMYLTKAECLARKGQFTEAMTLVNTLRKKRIIPELYADLSATTEEQAMVYIRRERNNEFFGTGMNYWDLRRFNTEPKYAKTLTKIYNGQTLSLSPTSHLWIMPFSRKAVQNNATLKQITEL